MKATHSWSDFVSYKVGRVEFKKPGVYHFELEPTRPYTLRPAGLAYVKLTKNATDFTKTVLEWTSFGRASQVSREIAPGDTLYPLMVQGVCCRIIDVV